MKIFDFYTLKEATDNMSPSKMMEWVDFALKYKDDFCMPAKSRINQADGDYYAIMPCMYEKHNVAMAKMIGRHALKPGENRPTMMSDLLLYEADTGMLKALMDAELITTLRTGASAAHSALLFANEDFVEVGVIGLGNIMTVCMDVFLDATKDRRIVLKLHKYHDHEIRMYDRYKHYDNVEFKFCDTYEDIMRDSDIIFSALTRTTTNFCNDDVYKEGVTIIPIMTMGFQNCDLFFDQVFTDEIEQITGFKYFNEFKEVTNITDVLNNRHPGRRTSKERILVYNYGLAIHDLYFASELYNRLSDSTADFEYRYCTDKFFMK